MVSLPLLPPTFWGLDGIIDSYAKFYIHDLLDMPEMESHTGIFQYRDHLLSTVDILGVIVKVVKRDKIIIYAVDDGTGVISCKCFKRTSILQEEAISKLKDELNGGPIEHKLNTILTEIEQGFNGFNIGELLHVRGTLQTYKNVREIKAYHCAVMHCLSAETERMLHLPLLYQSVYDKPFVLPDRLAREISSLPNGELDQRKLSHELRLQDEFMKLIVSHLDEKKLDKTSEHDLYESVKCSTEKVVNEPLLWKKALSSLEATGHLCRQSSKKGEYLVIKYNKQLSRSVIEIILKHAEHQKGNSDPGCHFMHIYDELRKLLPFSQLNKPSLWKCLGLLEEQSDIISSTEKHFIVFS